MATVWVAMHTNITILANMLYELFISTTNIQNFFLRLVFAALSFHHSSEPLPSELYSIYKNGGKYYVSITVIGGDSVET